MPTFLRQSSLPKGLDDSSEFCILKSLGYKKAQHLNDATLLRYLNLVLHCFEPHYFWSGASTGAFAGFATGTVAKQWRRREAEPRENEARTGTGRI